MLDLAAKRQCYVDLKKADLMQTLPFPANQFDFAISSAVTTYLGKFYFKCNYVLLYVSCDINRLNSDINTRHLIHFWESFRDIYKSRI